MWGLLFISFLLFYVSNACWDTPPSNDFTCVQQRDFGACNEPWMINGFYCDITCGRCCGDVPPDYIYTCEEQRDFGACNEPWMIWNNYCAQSCNRCVSGSSEGIKTTDSVTHQGQCTDNAPDSQFTCEEQRSFGQCEQQWMLNGDYCAKTCGRCADESLDVGRSSGVLTACGDIPPDDVYSCSQQRDWGACDQEWMIKDNFCQATCGRCEIPAGCSDTPPDNQFTCSQQKRFGQCDQEWMKQGNYCQTTCGRCDPNAAPVSTPSPPIVASTCTNVPPNEQYTCEQEASFGTCNRDYMISNNYCQRSCGRCPEGTPEAAVTAPETVAEVPSSGQKKRNFLIIMTDDQGYDDIGIHHPSGDLETPNQDKFAAESIEFSNFYTDSLCAPTRATLMTGRQHLKTGVWGVHGGMDFIDLTEVLLSQVMQESGYYTAQIGKWHSGKTSGYWPHHRGYEFSITPHLYTFVNTRVEVNGVEQRVQGWVEDWMADQLMKILQSRAQDGRPFLITWTPMAIHAGRRLEFESGEDFIAPEWALQKYAGRGLPEDIQKVFAFITYWDVVFGKVIDKLGELGLADDTVVMLFGDNGPMMYGTDHREGEDRILRMPSRMLWDKGFIEEGGTRNFLLVRQTGQTSPGRLVDKNVYVADIFPTVLELAGLTYQGNKPLDGISFAPLLFGNGWAHDNRVIITHESLKNTLVENLNLQLNDKRRTDLGQILLNFDVGATNGIGLKFWTAVRQGDFKLIKGFLYDIVSGRHLEWPRYRVDDPGLYNRMEQEARSWWENMLLTEYGAFQKPVFLIGYQGETFSEIIPYAANDWTPFRITLATHLLSGFQEIGDYISLKIRVKTEGNYQFKLNYGLAGDKGGVVRLQIGTWNQITRDRASSAEARLLPEQVTLGPLYLKVTPSRQEFQEMKITLIGRDVLDQTDIFWWFNLIEVFRV